jgi:ubiquinol-cytochrome c reductase subunit 9
VLDTHLQLSDFFYNSLVKRNSVYVTSIFAAAFGFGVAFDVGVTSFWDRWNKGVRRSSSYARCPLMSLQKQWKDIRHKYIEEE